MFMTQDPLGLARCAACANAYALGQDVETTRALRVRGQIGPRDFVCRACAARLREESA
jgi:hypothetical protein